MESLITELRKELRVTDDEHRKLLAMVNADELIGRIRLLFLIDQLHIFIWFYLHHYVLWSTGSGGKQTVFNLERLNVLLFLHRLWNRKHISLEILILWLGRKFGHGGLKTITSTKLLYMTLIHSMYEPMCIGVNSVILYSYAL